MTHLFHCCCVAQKLETLDCSDLNQTDICQLSHINWNRILEEKCRSAVVHSFPEKQSLPKCFVYYPLYDSKLKWKVQNVTLDMLFTKYC
jgi:hypothetical protein